jgi:hypothetical protein
MAMLEALLKKDDFERHYPSSLKWRAVAVAEVKVTQSACMKKCQTKTMPLKVQMLKERREVKMKPTLAFADGRTSPSFCMVFVKTLSEVVVQ